LVDNREEFNLLVGEKTEDWVIGKALDYNKIVLISPEGYETSSTHKFSKSEYEILVRHEIGHLFYQIFSQGKGPVWLEEGFAIYTSGELNTKKRPKVFNSFLRYYNEEDDGVYSESGFVVADLIENFGKEKVVEFLRLLPKVNDEKEFKKIFKEYFDMKLEYSSF
jgi:hypothetical protein